MKIVLWICGLFFCFFTYECFVNKPFVKELPLLLLPDTDTKISFQEGSNDAINFLWDMRSDCIQTVYNFCSYSNWEVKLEGEVTKDMSHFLFSNLGRLFMHAPLFQKHFTFEANPVVWIERSINPMKMIQERKAVGKNAGFFVKMGSNDLPCQLDLD